MNITDYNADLWHVNRKIIIEKALLKALSCLKILREYRQFVNSQTRARNSVSNFPQGRDVMAVSPTGFLKSMIFSVFHCLHLPDKNCHLQEGLKNGFCLFDKKFSQKMVFLVCLSRIDIKSLLSTLF